MVREQVFAHWGYWHLSPKGLKSLFKVLWELHHSVGNKCMVVHVTVMDSSQLSTSWSPCPERALTSSIVIGWVAAAMMSSILNRDFISMRLIVQGMSLKKWKKKRIIKMAINCIERADNDSCRHDKWMQGTGLIWLICHLLLSRISTETLRRGSAESTDSSWTQDEDIWAMLTESTMNCVNTHKKSQKKL